MKYGEVFKYLYKEIQAKLDHELVTQTVYSVFVNS